MFCADWCGKGIHFYVSELLLIACIHRHRVVDLTNCVTICLNDSTIKQFGRNNMRSEVFNSNYCTQDKYAKRQFPLFTSKRYLFIQCKNVEYIEPSSLQISREIRLNMRAINLKERNSKVFIEIPVSYETS